MPTLTLLKDGEAIGYKLDDVTVLGRAPECQIQLDSNMVSRRHAQVTRDKASFFVEDLGSGNGTFVNGKRIAERTLLKANDRVKLGPILLRFETSDSRQQTRVDQTGNVEITGEMTATIMESADNTSGFGVLQVKP